MGLLALAAISGLTFSSAPLPELVGDASRKGFVRRVEILSQMLLKKSGARRRGTSRDLGGAEVGRADISMRARACSSGSFRSRSSHCPPRLAARRRGRRAEDLGRHRHHRVLVHPPRASPSSGRTPSSRSSRARLQREERAIERADLRQQPPQQLLRIAVGLGLVHRRGGRGCDSQRDDDAFFALRKAHAPRRCVRILRLAPRVIFARRRLSLTARRLRRLRRRPLATPLAASLGVPHQGAWG